MSFVRGDLPRGSARNETRHVGARTVWVGAAGRASRARVLRHGVIPFRCRPALRRSRDPSPD
jgi:hypothetical protein